LQWFMSKYRKWRTSRSEEKQSPGFNRVTPRGDEA
jgi:hypothetical protein